VTGWTGKLAALNKNVIVSSSRAYAHGGIRVWVSYPLVGMTYFFHIKYMVKQWKYICHYITWSENSRKFISPHDQKNWAGHCRVAICTVIITIYYIIRYISLEIIFYKLHHISYIYNLRFIFERIYLSADSIYTIKILGHVPEFGNDHTKPYKISVYYTWRKNGN